MNKEQQGWLLELADRLEAMRLKKGQKFDMQTWKRKDDCGTSACAIGWYSIFHPRRFPIGLVEHNPFPFDTIAAHFDIYLWQAQALFTRSSYLSNSRRSIARRIRKFAKSYQVTE